MKLSVKLNLSIIMMLLFYSWHHSWIFQFLSFSTQRDRIIIVLIKIRVNDGGDEKYRM